MGDAYLVHVMTLKQKAKLSVTCSLVCIDFCIKSVLNTDLV